MGDRTEVYVVKCVKYVLSQLRSKLPIKRAAIVSNALESKTQFETIFNLAKARLLQSYGLNTEEISPGVYIVYSKFSFESGYSLNKEQKKEMLLLTPILYLIRSKGDTVSEEVLFKHLLEIGIDVNMDHPFFGANLKNLITKTFVKQLYINREKQENIIMYSFGSRAKIEFPKELLATNLEKITQKIKYERK